MNNELEFFITTDIHLGASDSGSEDYEISLENMEKLNPTAPLVIPGDFSNFGDGVWMTELHRLLKKNHKRPVLFTLGNHDVRGRKGGLSEKPNEDGWFDQWRKIWVEGVDSLDDPRFFMFLIVKLS